VDLSGRTSECYGAVAGFIDYGPLGAMMKRRVENIWRDFYIVQEGYYEIECPTIAQEAVFIASGMSRVFLTRCASALTAGNTCVRIMLPREGT